MAGINLRLCSSSISPSILTFGVSIAIAMVGIHLLLCSFKKKRYRRYDVFLSFRGRDLRKGFVDHLHHALTAQGFRVFLDTHDLQRGKNIWEALHRAIEGSRILIPILSTNYAKSAWCLREVSLIASQVHKEKKKGSAIVVPLFYNVTPTQVRHPHQSHGSPFAEAFQEHDSSGKYDTQEINEWKTALSTISNLSGWSLQEDTNGYESAMVKLVVEYVAHTLDREASI